MAGDSRLDRLNVLIGKWGTTITLLNPGGGDGDVTRATDIYTWSANGKFVQHDVDADMGSGRVQSLEVIALASSGEGYVSRSYDPDGTFSDFVCALDGRSWSIIGAMQRFSGLFSEDGSLLSGKWEQNDGAGQWTPLMKVVLQKYRD